MSMSIYSLHRSNYAFQMFSTSSKRFSLIPPRSEEGPIPMLKILDEFSSGFFRFRPFCHHLVNLLKLSYEFETWINQIYFLYVFIVWHFNIFQFIGLSSGPYIKNLRHGDLKWKHKKCWWWFRSALKQSMRLSYKLETRRP